MTVSNSIQFYPALRFSVVLIAGIVFGRYLHTYVPAWVWLTAAFVCCGVGCVCMKRPLVSGCALLLSAFSVGAWLCGMAMAKLDRPLPEGWMEYEAVLMSQPQERGKNISCDLVVVSGPMAGRKVKASIGRDTLAGGGRLSVGDGLYAVSQMKPFEDYRPSEHFNYREWVRVQGFSARTFIRTGNWQKSVVSLKKVSLADRLRLRAVMLRQTILDKYRSSGLQGDDYAVLAAMTMGDKSTLSPTLKDRYATTGASHILALSGLHVGVVYFTLLLLFWRRKHAVLTQASVVTALWIYAFMAGLPSSVVRAVSMFSVYAVASLLNRERISLNSLSLAALAMLVCNPLLLWDIGFQLSFLAVLGILLCFTRLGETFMPQWIGRFWLGRKLWQLCALSLSAQMGVAPLVMFYFGRFSCYFLLTNLFVIPLSMLILYLFPVFLLFMAVPVLGGWMAGVLSLLVRFMNGGLAVLSTLPGASIEEISINLWQLMLMYMLIVAFCVLSEYLYKMWRAG